MKLSQHKKAATQLRGLKFLFAVMGIVFILLIFYVWVQKNVSHAAKQEAEITASEIELRTFYSDLIRTQGTEIAQKSSGDVENIIDKFAENYISVPNGGYSTDCTTTGIDKECTLTITLHETLATVSQWGMYMSIASTVTTLGMTYPITIAMVALKLIANDAIKVVEQEAYLPIQNNAMKFKLKTRVEFA